MNSQKASFAFWKRWDWLHVPIQPVVLAIAAGGAFRRLQVVAERT